MTPSGAPSATFAPSSIPRNVGTTS